MKNITILGSTGSIGTQTLQVIRENPEDLSVHALVCRKNIELLSEQIREFRPSVAVVGTEELAKRLSEEFPDVEVLFGAEGTEAAAADSANDMVVNALVGMSGLVPTYRAIKAGTTVALANKETLVAGGSLIMKESAERSVPILPVDSEHSAIFQSLQGFERRQVRRILLTASGGPFRGKKLKELENVTAAQALKHPNWSMGNKVTIDSSTLMNKGFEVIEARWLFDADPDIIDVVVHPESIVHSMVEYEDRAVIAQLGTPDMRVPISYALGYPHRIANEMEPLDLIAAGRLTFEKPDMETFKCLGMAYDALKAGGTYCTALNAADEVLVEAFLKGRIGYTDIQNIIGKVLDAHVSGDGGDLGSILDTDREVRILTEEYISGKRR